MADVKINVEVISAAAQRSVAKLGDAAKGTERDIKSLNVRVQQTTSAFKVFAGTLASTAFSAATRGITSLVKSSFQAAQSVETLATQFEVLTGSVSTATTIMEELEEFSARTPFQFESIGKAAQRLLSFGFAVDTLKPRLQTLGDVSAASGADINELALIFGQVNAAGKLTGERLLQFQERAIPIGPAIAKTMGVAESSVRDLVSRGEVDFATFERAFKSLADEGNFAFGGMEKRSQTLAGRISTLTDNIQLFVADIGKRLAPALKGVVAGLTEFIGQLRVSPSLQEFTDTIGNALPQAFEALRPIVEGLVVVFQGFAHIINGVTTAIKFFAGAAAGITEIGITNITQLRDFMRETTDEIVEEAARRQEAINLAADATIATSDRVLTAISTNTQKEQAAAEAATAKTEQLEDRKQKAAKKTSDFKASLNKFDEQKTASSLSTISTLMSNSSREFFEIGKAVAVANATIKAFEAHNVALAAAPPPFNFALAALVDVASAATIAKIASTQPPKFAQGGIVPGNSFAGDSVAARVNSGEMILNRQQQNELFRIANGERRGGQATEVISHVTVELDGEVVGRAVSRQVADGLKLGEVV